MGEAKPEKIQSVTSILIWLGFFVFAYGFAYKDQTVMLIGMFCLGVNLTIHAPMSLITLSHWQKDEVKQKSHIGASAFLPLDSWFSGFLLSSAELQTSQQTI